MKSVGEGFNQQLAGLEGKPGALIPRNPTRQPGGVVLDLNIPNGGLGYYGEPLNPTVEQPRVKNAIS